MRNRTGINDKEFVGISKDEEGHDTNIIEITNKEAWIMQQALELFYEVQTGKYNRLFELIFHTYIGWHQEEELKDDIKSTLIHDRGFSEEEASEKSKFVEEDIYLMRDIIYELMNRMHDKSLSYGYSLSDIKADDIANKAKELATNLAWVRIDNHSKENMDNY